jgi:4-hydroxy-tetrahydrodipicolinate reductase
MTCTPSAFNCATLRMVAETWGLPVDEIVTRREFAVTRNRLQLGAGTLEAGTIGAIRMEITGLRNGKPVIRRRSVWYVTRDVDADWDLRDTGLHYRVEGDTPLDVMITIPVSDEDYPDVSPGLTAHPVVNAIPYVCEARPGILQTPELPLMAGMFGGTITMRLFTVRMTSRMSASTTPPSTSPTCDNRLSSMSISPWGRRVAAPRRPV